MKILLLIGCKRWSFNRRLNAGFVEKLSKFKDIELVIHDRVTISRNGPLLNIYNNTKPDLIICYAKLGRIGLVNIVSQVTCPKIMIDVDYHHNPGSLQKLYKSCKFDLILQRGVFQAPNNFPIPWIWLPWSADDSFFFPMKDRTKQEKLIGFAASINKSYKSRIQVTNILRKQKLLKVCKKCFSTNYSDFLRHMLACLSASEAETPHGKLFEIIASGSIVLTNPFRGEVSLFGQNSPLIKYKKDFSDLLSKTKYILNNQQKMNELQEKGLEIFYKSHTDDIRIQELYYHIQNVVNGKKPEKIWNI